MAFVARKPFLHKGTQYRPGDVVYGFPEDFFRAEGFIRTGMVVSEAEPRPLPPKPVIEEQLIEDFKPKRRKSQPKVEVESSEELVGVTGE